MIPLQDIHFRDPLSEAHRNAVLFEGRESRLFQAIIEYLREEAFANLGIATAIRRGIPDEQGRVPTGNADMIEGGFDGISQAVVKLYAQSQIAPPPPQ